MIPIPQYPLYSASLAQFDIEPVGYFLDEDNNWALDVSELMRAHKEAEGKCRVRAIVVINPGNPTGSVRITFREKAGALIFIKYTRYCMVWYGRLVSAALFFVFFVARLIDTPAALAPRGPKHLGVLLGLLKPSEC